MSASIAAAMFGGEGCESIGLAVQVQALVLCTFSTDPGRINTPSLDHPRNVAMVMANVARH